MTPAALKIAVPLLKRAAREFSNHGCNDFNLENTPENYAFVEDMLKWNGDKDYLTPHLSSDKMSIDTQDWLVMSYLAHLMKEESK